MESTFGLSAAQLDCGMEANKSHKADHDKTLIDKSECCKNQSQLVQLDEESSLKQQKVQLNFDFAVAFVQVFMFEITGFPTEEPIHLHDTSPPLSEDLIILNQTFLI